VRHHGLRNAIPAAGALIALSSAAALALGSERIVAEQAAYRAPAAGRCEPSALNQSALLPGTPLSVSPLPDSFSASATTQISLLGAPAVAIRDVRVRGSNTGGHSGRLRAYSQGDGASFVLAKPFRPGETVTVRGRVLSGARSVHFGFHFTIAHRDVLPHKPMSTPPTRANQVAHFHSRPDLQPPLIVVSARSPLSAPGYMFAAPYSGGRSPGALIFEEDGEPVWFNPLPPSAAASNLQVQQLGGKPVLTWWQGYIPEQGFGEGEEVILDSSYNQVGRVHAGNGYKADLHEFHITPQGTALLSVFAPVDCDLSGLGGPKGGAVTDSIFQEVDLRTALVRREWHSLDHVALSESHSSAVGTSKNWPLDFFHINSIDQRPDGTTLISARNTWALYVLSTRGGQVLATLGGRHSAFKLSGPESIAYQHDAATLPNGTISIFDNGAVPKVHPQSRGIVLAINPHSHRASLLSEFEHPKPLSSASQGNFQALPNGDWFVGWGAAPYFSEFSPSGQLLFDAHMHGTYQSYRGYRFPWTGAPGQPPAVAAVAARKGAPETVYASWNGDTRTSSWRVLAGPSAQALAPVQTAPRSGFETAIALPAPGAFVAVQALDSSGAVLGTSKTISP
jgi:arylsulfotransferase ASST